MDYELVKKLSRKRVRSLAELAALDPVSRLDALTSVGALQSRVRVRGACGARASQQRLGRLRLLAPVSPT